MKKIILLIVVSLFLTGARFHKESKYQEEWCKGNLEFVLPDKTRVDCLTLQYAIEFDFADKGAEAIGQAIHYGLMTQRTPGVVLIIEKDSDWKYWQILNRINKTYNLGITVWVTGSQNIKKEEK